MSTELVEALWPSGYDRLVLDEVDSTMAETRRRASELAGPTWILAHHQTAAKGRRGRAWANPNGNFAATLFLRPDCTALDAALRSFTAACALYQTLALCAQGHSLTLKWPNDVLLNGGKVAGILLESSGQGDRIDWVSIGIGVNLVAAPDISEVEADAVPPVSLKGETGQAMEPEEFLAFLAGHFASLEGLFQEFGFDPIRRLWLRHAARLGEIITARTPQDEVTGIFETVNETGQLVLGTPKGQVQLSAADVYF